MSQGLRTNDYSRYYQTQTFINYSKSYMYQYIHNKLTDLTDNEKQTKIKIIFKQCMNEIRTLATECDELDRFNTPMAFLFPHLKITIIKLLANCSPSNEKQILELGLDPYTNKVTYNLEYNKLIYKRCIELEAKDLALWLLFHVPYYNNSQEDIIYYRLEYELTLDWAIQHWDITFTESEFIFASNETCLPYALAYHNQNNVTLLQKYCLLLRKIAPWLNYYSSSLAAKMFKNSKKNLLLSEMDYDNTFNLESQSKIKRIVFISDSMCSDSSVLRDRASIIGKLDKSKFEVYFASFIPYQNAKGIVSPIFVNRFRDHYIYLGLDITSARLVLEKYEFDIIVYPDLGMKLLPTLLAYSRLANIQITTWGHSETSGIDTIDYYISSEWFSKNIVLEGNYYSEKLILMSSLSTYYVSPHKLFISSNKDFMVSKKRFKTREELGFKKDDHLYCCLQTFYKFNEDFEITLGKIIELDPKAIILLSNTFPFCKSHLFRLRKRLGEEKLLHMRWYHSLDKLDFLNIVSICDVCLDPFPFGGCNTSYDAFDYHVPVITYPSDYLHGRFTYGLYSKMGLSNCECIARDNNEYAKLAVEMGINEKLKHKMQRNIEMNKYKIFQEDESVGEWNNVLDGL